MIKNMTGARVVYRGPEISLRDRRGTVIASDVRMISVLMDTSQVGRGLIVSVSPDELEYDEFMFQDTNEMYQFLVSQFKKSRPIIPSHCRIVNTPRGSVLTSLTSRKEQGYTRFVFLDDGTIDGITPPAEVLILEVGSDIEMMFGKVVARPIIRQLMVNPLYEHDEDDN